MTPAEFDALFDSFRQGVFRLETLPVYDVGGSDGERLEAFRGGRALPERSVRTSPWLARIAVSTVTQGKTWERIRVVDDPLTTYQDYEIRAYQESQAAGERIWIVHRDQIQNLGPDFWLFDPDSSEARAVLMDYAPDGRWLGSHLVTDPEQVREFANIRRAAMAKAMPLNEFLVTRRAGQR